jgi:protein SCO1
LFLIGAMNRPKRVCVLILLCAALGGCRQDGRLPSPSTHGASNGLRLSNSAAVQPNATNNLRAFNTRGVVKDLPQGGRSLLVKHEDIPGYMPAMTMQLDVRDTNELRGLLVGDTITFQVVATEEDSWIEGIRRVTTNEARQVASAEPSAASILRASLLKPGELLPDAELLAEDGRSFKLSDFEGQAVAFTFIFTRCPLPNFCPRMNQNFYRAREILFQEKGITNWHFLSISFDPDFDKPGVLSRYAWSYRGENSNGWTFASAATNVVTGMSPLLDFRFANDGGSFQHNLRTVVLDPHRRVVKHFEGNSWKAAELAEAIKEAVATSKRASL